MKVLKQFKWYELLLALVIIAFVIVQVNFEIKLIKVMGTIVGYIKLHGTGAMTLTVATIGKEVAKMLGIAFLIFGCIVVVSFIASLISSGYAKRLRASVFKKVVSFSMEEMNQFSINSLITRTTNDITQIQQSVYMTLRMAVTAPIMAIFALKEIVGSSIQLSGVTAISLLVMFVFIIVIFLVISPKYNKVQKLTDKLNGVTRENLTGLKVIKAYDAEEIQQEKFEKVNTDLTKTTLFVNKVSSLMMPGMYFIMNGLSLAIYWLGAYLINAGALQYEVMVTFSQYSMQVLMSFIFISMLFIMLPRGIVSAKRVNQILKTQTKILDGTGVTTELKGEIEFIDVSFKYPMAETNVLENISFKVNKGETVAFIGSTGSGKSTLINLIPRFFDVSNGEVLVDGVNVKNYKLEELTKKIGYVPQKGILFSGSVEENIKYGKLDATNEELEKSIDTAQSKFVYELEDGLKYNIAQGGTNVSGGQRQRLSIARAIIKKPEIIIFDDSFSALDYKTDKNLRKTLKSEIKDSTKIIVAQRIGTIMDADKIIVLDEGKVVGIGKHKELLQNCKVYKEIALSQLSKEEL